MGTQLAQQIGNLKGGDHACLIYDDHEGQMAAVLPFFKAGLERNESCLYVTNDHTQDEINSAFSGYGINLKHEVGRGALTFASDTTKGGAFNPAEMVDNLRGMVVSAQRKGFAGFRAAGEMTWVLGAQCTCKQLTEYEALLDLHFPARLTGICQYNRQKFSPEFISGILRTHPVVIVGDKVCRNLYCESGKILSDNGQHEIGVDWMLENLIKFHTIEDNLRNMIRVREEFLTIASHELNTPLTALMLLAQTYGKKDSLTPEEWKQFCEVNLRNIDGIVGIVESMLDVTRIAHRGLTLEYSSRLDLVKITQQCARQFAGSEIHINGPSPVVGDWDVQRVRQVVTNLISNAIKYGRGNRIDIEVTSTSDLARFVIRDRGMGIAAEDRERIFKLFERAIPYTQVSGLGVGLYLCDQIVAAHGGRLRVESELGKGSMFSFVLPLGRPV